MIDYLRALVAVPTLSSDPAANNQALAYIQEHLQRNKLHIKRYDFNGHHALVATTRENAFDPKVMLTAHLDVVPADDALFTLREEDGKYFGRGVYDMKFAIATYLKIIDRLAADNTLQQYDLGIMITTEEEIGGHNGVLPLMELGYRPKICILPDGGENWNIETLAKGLSYGHIYVDGKTAHGSRPWEGDSAILKLVDVLDELRDIFDEQKLHSNTLNVGKIDGGEAINQIPSKAHATIDIRYIRHEDRLRLHDQMLAIFARHGVTYTEEFYDQPCITDLEHPLVKPFIDSVEEVTGYRPTGTLSVGGSDARHLAKYGVPAILTHPQGGGQHAGDEWISKEGINQFYDVVMNYLQKVALS